MNKKIEMVDVVDKDDNVLRTVPRSEAEENNERVRGVQVILVNDAGEILVQWRRADKKMYPRTFTASAAGMVNAGEPYELAAMRELAEEMGVVTKLELLGSYQANKGHLVNGQLYVGNWDGDVFGWEEEADGLDMWTREEAKFMLKRFPYLLAPTFRESLKIFLKGKK